MDAAVYVTGASAAAETTTVAVLAIHRGDFFAYSLNHCDLDYRGLGCRNSYVFIVVSAAVVHVAVAALAMDRVSGNSLSLSLSLN